MEELEPILHDLWYVYYQGGMHLSCSNAEQDRLAFDLFRTQGLGRLTREARSNGSVETAQLSGSVFWEDLPFFVTDMTDFWVNDFATMGATKRLNLSSFFAKLASTGLDNDGLCRIALMLLRDTFETVRPLGSLDEQGNATDSLDTTIQDLSIAALLPAACAWIRESGLKLIKLSDVSWNDCPDTFGQNGASFTKSELGQKSQASAGFSPWRWLYWLKRLQEIADEATQAEETSLGKHASEAIKQMLSAVDWRESLVLKEFEATPDLIHNQYRYLHPENYDWEDSSDFELGAKEV